MRSTKYISLMTGLILLLTASITSAQTSPEAIALSFIEQFNSGQLDNDLYAEGFLLHHPPSMHAEPMNRAATIAWIVSMRGQFPDMRVEPDRVLTDDAYVTVQYRITFTAASGSPASIPGIDIYRVDGDKLAEVWMVYDTQTMAQSLVGEPMTAMLGTYTTTISNQDVVDGGFNFWQDLAGDWVIDFNADGSVDLHYKFHEREYTVTGSFVVADDTITFGEESGEYACNELYDIDDVTYRWQIVDDTLIFETSDDPCHERRIVFTAHPLRRQMDN